ncbi:hypothetical protein PENSPDRAFT_46918 [Peniophora sp. CONT]|nr:hypothetical protein PENSPDRAFT_46918 [Peniophora sp. CONT]
MSDRTTSISPEHPLTGGCFCGALKYALSAPPKMSGYCHCTQCQRLNGCPFVHTIHFPTSSFAWTSSTPNDRHEFNNSTKPHKTRIRCAACGCCVASHNSKTGSTSVWGAQLDRDGEGRIVRYDEVRPVGHMFYGTRIVDVKDGLGKWEGYYDISTRMDES